VVGAQITRRIPMKNDHYGVSPWFISRGQIQSCRLLVTGTVLLAVFVLLRVSGAYGEDQHQTGQPWLPFLNVQKSPPSLHYSLLAVGLLALILAAFANLERNTRLGALSILAPYGKAPFAFYCTHIGLIHVLALIVATTLHWDRGYLFWSRVGPNL